VTYDQKEGACEKKKIYENFEILEKSKQIPNVQKLEKETYKRGKIEKRRQIESTHSNTGISGELPAPF